MSSTLFIHHPHFDQHSVPPDHPESPLRSLAVETRLRQTGLWQDLSVELAKPINKELFKLVHKSGYIDQLYQISPRRGMILADPDTPLTHNTLEATEEAAGAGIQAIDQVLSGRFENAFCAVRPPGHHAEPTKSMGFCFVNNISLAAQYALTKPGINKVLIFDFDVHQGNGTIEIFKNRDDVMVVSSFQHPYFPYSHYNVKADNIINIPVDAGSASLSYRRLVEPVLIKAASSFKPDLILVSAGFDAHEKDPMGELNLVEDDYTWLTKLTMSLARDYSKGRIISMLEGGYNLEALADSAHAHIQTLSHK